MHPLTETKNQPSTQRTNQLDFNLLTETSLFFRFKRQPSSCTSAIRYSKIGHDLYANLLSTQQVGTNLLTWHTINGVHETSQVLTVVLFKIPVFCDMMQSQLVHKYRAAFHSTTTKMEATSSFETSVTIYQSTWRHVPKDLNLQGTNLLTQQKRETWRNVAASDPRLH